MRGRFWLAGLLLAATAVAAAWLWWLLADLPSPAELRVRAGPTTTKLYDRQGRLLYEVLDPRTGHRTIVPLADIPPALQQATIATEDAAFYTHAGVDVWGIVRAAWINLQGDDESVVVGGSTITQQVVRVCLLSESERGERTLRRKIREAVLALRLTSQYDKDEILALYLNQVYYGHLAYGVEAAAQVYFGKPARDLDIAECALLAGLPQAPALYDPLTDLPRAQERQRVVLDLMRKQGVITAQQVELAAAEPLRLAPAPTRAAIQAPHFCMFVVSQLEAWYGTEAVLQGGLQVYTTLDLDAQRRAEEAVQRRLARLTEPAPGLPAGHHVTDAAVVALDPATGEVLVMVGSPDYFDQDIAGAVNVALSPRQPGSAIKPFTYAAALAQGLTPATVFYDVRTSFTTREGEPYVPENYDRQFHGPVSLRTALGSSLNVVAVQVLDRVGLPALIDTAQALGIHTFTDADRYGLALTLGGGEVRLLELTSAYGVFATGGVRHEPAGITRVTDAAGRVLYQREPSAGQRVLPATVAYLITDILADDDARLVGFGEGSVLDWRDASGAPAAVKTGTTTDWRDNWTVGYVPGLVVGVWAGNADGSPMIQVSGITGAAPIWRDVMETLTLPLAPSLSQNWEREGVGGGRGFPEPPGLVCVVVCPASGLLPGPDCPHRRTELFIAGTEPTAACDVHQAFRVCAASGQLATDRCPADLVETRVFQVFPSAAQEWAREQGISQPPVEPCPVHGGTVGTSSGALALVVTSPDEGSVFRVSPALPSSDQRIALAARVEGHGVIAWIEFRVDGVAVGRATVVPWQVFWTLASGAHAVQAVAQDRQGQTVGSAPVHFVVE